MRVIVTRPEHSAARTAARLTSLGHEPVLFPLTRPQHHPHAAARALEEPHAALAVTSAEALRALETIGTLPRPVLATPLFAVGKATGRAAQDLGFIDVRIGPGNGRGLAAMIGAEPLTGVVLYLAGTPRSPAFEADLTASGTMFRTTEVYEMLACGYSAAGLEQRLLDSVPDAVLLYSAEAARIFFDLLAPHLSALARLRIFAISDSVKASTPSELHHNVTVAARPDEEALFDLL